MENIIMNIIELWTYTKNFVNILMILSSERDWFEISSQYCFIVGLAFLPQLYVIYTSFLKTSGQIFLKGYSLDSYKYAFTHLKKAIPNTFIIGAIALILVIVLAILISYLVVRRNNAMNKVIDTISMIPYIIPGSVVGIALVMAFNRKPLVLLVQLSLWSLRW